MSGPEFEGVLAGHRQQHNPATGASDCLCGEWVGPFTVTTGPGTYPAHLSAALHAELARWLGDEGTREVVADRVGESRPYLLTGQDSTDLYDAYRSGDDCVSLERMVEDIARRVADETTTAALAALTTTDQEMKP